MGVNDEKPPRAPLKRGRSLSESLRGLFRQGSPLPTPSNSNHGSRNPTAPSSPVSEAAANVKRNNSKSSKLGKLATSKEAELSSSRGVPPPHLQPQTQSLQAPVGQRQYHLGLPHIGKLSLGHDGAHSNPDNDRLSQESALSEEEDLSQVKRMSPEAVPEVNEEDTEEGLSASSAGSMDSGKHLKSTSSAGSVDSGRHQKPQDHKAYHVPPTNSADATFMIDVALENDEPEIRNSQKHSHQTHGKNGSLNRSGSCKRSDNSSSSSTSSNRVYPRGRSRAGTVSASSLPRYSETDAKCVLQVENFKVYENGMHEHNLKVTPLVTENAEGRSESLVKQKSAFSLTQIFKPRKEDNKLLEDAVSLIPQHKNRTSSPSAYDRGEPGADDVDEQDVSNIKIRDDDGVKTPKIVNPKAAVGSAELKLINTLSEKIHKSFKNKAAKAHPLVDGHLHRRAESGEESENGSTFFETYGKPVGIVGHGAYGTVKVCAKLKTSKDVQPLPTFCNGNKLYFGVKELRPKPTDQIEKFSTRITSEFIIGHSLSRYQKRSKCAPNILKILDLMECSDAFIEVMEFCPAGDLFNLLTRKSKTGTVLHPIEADCFMKQLLHGVQFMHMHGVAHCDLKPENILFYPNGLLKICDFGTSCVFQTAWEKHVHFQSGTMGSEPYVAPEEFDHDKEYDPRLADCWSCGVVYCTMVLGHYLWKVAIRSKDMLYDSFCNQMAEKKEFDVLEEMRHTNPETTRLRKIALYYIFQVDPRKRITVDELLQTAWMKRTRCCVFYNKEKPLAVHSS
ncbi:HAL5 (YJL165C) and KKQ8 (YKL168C) [Zygosaccharomyces parabailii]|uniref:non-specific serine/threonine protein kinase n=1 Tax=Zygosaccharomyces bailii (strain CLIB 213 / ATCC 58445 / CBS 680 / BCRC 21525 / NBRC 1098 / NCYC 1416 / NRRL Y-2227) TaxID=1333698 RepID=A0A8J2X1U7_ZYGB2|nr:HAL5 (YJL165C) and KKQ8 (YKL168C) [Zygosaccharomyces parabailii]CDF90311.1 ZYBA0S06-05622g1_1 [Zygosaccharomyces bailii CLIB 213]CDH11465.1 related to serine/threonine-protein kinase HAL5-like [Zygosaccharomyces bailii ISA1307]